MEGIISLMRLFWFRQINNKQNLVKKNQVVENKVSDVTGLVTTDVFATKVEKKIRDDTVLVTASVLTTIEIDRKILDASGLIGNKDYDSKISDPEK